MSERLPRLSAKQIIRILERRGFVLARSSGSHFIYKNSQGVRATVPLHANKTLHPKVLQTILHDTGITVEELKTEL